jgi:exodeoxyribonuclease V alpha subunit
VSVHAALPAHEPAPGLAPVTVAASSPADAPGFAGRVEIKHRVWVSPDGARAILRAHTSDGRELSLVGAVGHLDEGDFADVEGDWKIHARHGPQVQVRSAIPANPPGGAAAVKFLTRLPGIGLTCAKRLIEVHGDDIFEALDRDAARIFADVRGLGARKAAEAARAWQERRGEKELFVFLQPYRLGFLVRPLLERYGARAMTILIEDPYRLVRERGVGFATADRIAQDCGIPADSPARAEAAVLHCLAEIERQGHTCAAIKDVLARAEALVGPIVDARILGALERRRSVVINDGLVWRGTSDRVERLIGGHVGRLLAGTPTRRVRVPEQPQGGLTGEQWTAVRRAFDHGISVVTGGPGTGKTTLVRAIVTLAAREQLSLALCAPTGRAARRLAQASGQEASTIHRLLEWGQGEGDGPTRDSEDPLLCDLVVVDEASMAGHAIFMQLLDALPTGCRVVVVGDVDQLPSVDCGRVLADLLDSGVIPVTRLTRPQRQAQRSLIVRAAHAINSGHLPSTQATEGDDVERDFFFIDERDPHALTRLVGDLVCARLPGYYDLDPLRDILVLSPAKKGPAGVIALNAHLGQRLNGGGQPIGPGVVRVGDKALWSEINDVELGLMNGMTVVVDRYDAQAGKAYVTDEDNRIVEVPNDKLRYLQPAYAMTVHRAQGVESPVTITVVHRQGTHPELLARSLVYTAVTRARQVSLIVGDGTALAEAVGRVRQDARRTGLIARLRAAMRP